MAAWTAGQQKALGWYYFAVALVTFVVAFMIAPISEWGTWGMVIGLALALLGLVGLYMGITGKGNTRSSTMSLRSQRIIAIVGLIAVTLAAFGTVLSDINAFTAQDALTVGVWVALGGLFVSQIMTIGKGE